MSTSPTAAVTGSEVDRIGALREEIDACDGAIIDLVQRRLTISQEIGAVRKASGGTRLKSPASSRCSPASRPRSAGTAPRSA